MVMVIRTKVSERDYMYPMAGAPQVGGGVGKRGSPQCHRSKHNACETMHCRHTTYIFRLFPHVNPCQIDGRHSDSFCSFLRIVLCGRDAARSMLSPPCNMRTHIFVRAIRNLQHSHELYDTIPSTSLNLGNIEKACRNL